MTFDLNQGLIQVAQVGPDVALGQESVAETVLQHFYQVVLSHAGRMDVKVLVDELNEALQKLVHDLLMKRLLDGQFEDCDLTLTELHKVEQSLSKSLIALYHSRIKYPEMPERKAG